MLHPRSIAIVGATPASNKLNGRPLHFLRRDGYPGAIWPVNPRYADIDGLKCYPDIAALPGAPDMAIIAVAAARAEETIAALGAKGCPVAVLFSSGFGELGAEGKALERSLIATARASDVRICGPNTLGLVSAFDRAPATFSQYADIPPLAGPVGFASQSGAFGTGISALARSRGLGFGYFVSTGNTADITPVEVLREMLEDDRIKVLAGYLEGLADGFALIALASEALDRGKPLVITKVGRSPAGAKAAASHTGSLAGEDVVFDWVARQAGIIRARNEEHMLDVLSALVCNHAPEGDGLAIITQSGGAGVLMADRAEEIGLSVPTMHDETRGALAGVLPDYGATANPIDVTGQFLADPRILAESVRIALDDPRVHVCVIWLQLMHRYADSLVGLFHDIKRTVTKPFVVCWIEAPEKARLELMAAGICVIGATERAVDAAAGLVAWGNAARRHREEKPAASASTVELVPPTSDIRPVPSLQALAMLQSAGLAAVDTRPARTAEEAARLAAALGFPVALKIESADILHKTEVGGVALDLGDADAVRKAFEAVTASARSHMPAAKFDGVLVQKMARPGAELVLGLRRDPVFGHVVMVGLGGIFVEVLKDVAFAQVPVAPGHALRMLHGLRGRAILDGARGQPPVDYQVLAAAITALSELAIRHPEIEDLDLNPVFAGPGGVVAVDWLMRVRSGGGDD
ncbi:MAG: acetate--CoA ligase family protein [Hyphomicrobiaceae bacterium]